jgi:RND superfamily putative drug exporter
VLGAWLVAVTAGGFAAGPVFAGLENDSRPSHIEAARAYDQFGTADDTGGEVNGLVDGVAPRADAVRDAVLAAAGSLSGRADVQAVAHPFAPEPRAAALFGRDGGSLLVSVTLRAGTDESEDRALAAVRDRLHALAGELRAAGQPDARVRVGGNKLLNQEVNQQVRRDLERAEVISLPLTLVVLIFVFGGLIAAGLPVLAAVVSVAAAMVVLLGFASFTDLDQNTVTVVTLLGLGLSVDYGLLLVARYREEIGAGLEPEDALGRAWATAGRTVLFSALTVAAALAGLLMFDIGPLAALGAAGVSIAVVAMLAALTFYCQVIT